MKIFYVFRFILSLWPIDSASVMKKDRRYGGVKILGHVRDLKNIFKF